MSDLTFTDSSWPVVMRGNREIGDLATLPSGTYVFNSTEQKWLHSVTASELRAIANKLDELNTQSQTAKE